MKNSALQALQDIQRKENQNKQNEKKLLKRMFSKEAMSSPATDKKSHEQGPSEADEKEKLTKMTSENGNEE